MLAGERGPIRDVVLANAAAALKLVEKVDTLVEGVALAAEAIDRGDAASNSSNAGGSRAIPFIVIELRHRFPMM